MADEAVVHVGENSPEQVAFKLMDFVRKGDESKDAILDLYCECLLAVRSPGTRLSKNKATFGR